MQNFAKLFDIIFDHSPFGWQTRLYERLRAGDIPPVCDIPTGLGKTSVLAVWLLALAEQAAQPDVPLTLPRRLVYIVDRRAVVDQATSEAEQLLQRLRNPGPELADVAAALRELAAVPDPGFPVAVSTLRGQFADNRQWSHDPARPAIIVGTVDIIGSRLMFQGYGGLGAYQRSQHAALLGQDALLVLDEAQLAPAFLQTLRAVERTVHATSGELKRPFAFLSLTATQPRALEAPEDPRPPLVLEPEDFAQEETVRRRVRAAKHLRFALPPDGASGKADDALALRMAQEAVRLAGTNGATVVFVDKVILLDKIHAALCKLTSKERCLRLTGQMRGQERDEIFKEEDGQPTDPIFRAFRQPRPRAGRVDRAHPVFLLATSAGEVGVNFDADGAVCDLVSLERTAQRLGRVNRAGDQDGPAQVTVFLIDPPDKLNSTLAATYRLLKGLPTLPDAGSHDPSEAFLATPETLGTILKTPEAPAAFTPASDPPPLDPARLDDWSLTSLDQEEFARPQVSYWLRGITPGEEQAVTEIVWREELRYARDGDDACDMAKTCPPLPREILQVPAYRAANWLLARAKKYLGAGRKEADARGEEVAVLRDAAGKWDAWPLKHFLEKDQFEGELVNALVVLPIAIGGLTAEGYLDDAAEDPARDALGAPGLEASDGRTRRRVLLHGSPAAGWKAFVLSAVSGAGPFAERDSYPEIIKAAAKHFQPADEQQRYRLVSRGGEPEKSTDPDDESAPPSYRVEYFQPARTYPAHGEVLLGRHLAEAERCAERIVSQLGLPPAVRDAVVRAAAWHDLGKRREKWQEAIGNTDPGKFLAKSNNTFYRRGVTRGYRHEFGSLMDVVDGKQGELQSHPEADLILHLIAAHHGWGRPGFQENAYDVPERLRLDCAQAAQEAERRFDRLQRRFGWWGLAYLEVLVKCADGIASDRAAKSETPVQP